MYRNVLVTAKKVYGDMLVGKHIPVEELYQDALPLSKDKSDSYNRNNYHYIKIKSSDYKPGDMIIFTVE